MERTRYDLTARRIARADPSGFFCWLLTGFAQHLRFAGWLDTRSAPEQTKPEVTGDTVARLAQLHEVAAPWLFAVEFQTVPDPGMFARLHKEIGEWWDDLRPDELPDSRFQVAAAVVNLTGTSQSAPASRSYVFPTDGLTWTVQVRERYLAEESADLTLARVERDELPNSILPLIVLMQGASDPAIISRWIAKAPPESEPRRRADIGGMTLTLAALKDWFDPWKDALKEWNMLESPYVLELQAEAMLKAKREALKTFLAGRFGPLPAELKQRIDAVTDLDKADELIQAAALAKTLEDFTV